jgi:hypothetical protein
LGVAFSAAAAPLAGPVSLPEPAGRDEGAGFEGECLTGAFAGTADLAFGRVLAALARAAPRTDERWLAGPAGFPVFCGEAEAFCLVCLAMQS